MTACVAGSLTQTLDRSAQSRNSQGMDTIMGIHPAAIAAAVQAFVVLQGARLLITWAIRRFTPPAASNVVTLDTEREPDPNRDEHRAFRDDAVVDLAAARARRV